MSTTYTGKLHFTKQQLSTKYDKISLNTNINTYINTNFKNLDVNCLKRAICINKIHNQLLSNNTYLHVASHYEHVKKEEDDYVVRIDSAIPSLIEWMSSIKHEEFDEFDEFSSLKNNLESVKITCSECANENISLTYKDDNSIKYKKELVNLVLESMLYGLQDHKKYLLICRNIEKSDPEFILKVSLFCRRELNVRTISNFLLSISSYLSECRRFLKKYFNVIVNLPTDWIETVFYFMLISESRNIPNQLRKAMVTKFADFSTYQIGKYQNKKKEINVESNNIKLTLKNLIRKLHISEPIEHVMPLLGKQYPMTNDDFILSKLPGQWEELKAGKRMKIPIPETWETQTALHGNKAEVWEKLIDNNTLPYMAMIRNLRNLLQCGLSDYYHSKIAQSISKESNVIKGKLLPFQYFTAYKILEEYNENILKAQQKLENMNSEKRPKKPSKIDKGSERRNKIRKKIMIRKVLNRAAVSEENIKLYTTALNKAVEISTIHNVPPIKGKVCILSNIHESEICTSFKYGSTKSIKEIIALLTSMCYFASECADIYLVRGLVSKFTKNPMRKSILDLSNDILAFNEHGILLPNRFMDEITTKQIQFDMILTFNVDITSNLFISYIKNVNPFVKIFVCSLNSTSHNLLDQKIENIFHITGFNEQTIKIIAEQNNGDIINIINSIDDKYNLDDINGIVNDQAKFDLENVPYETDNHGAINIFISSTFADMEKERSIINKLVIPALKRNLSSKNLNFIDINCVDLRWGVPVHWGTSEKLLQYCIEQVKRCHIFVGILGSRYGWVPDSNIINNLSSTYPELVNYEGLSITNIEYKFASSNCQKVFLLKAMENEDEFDHPELQSFRQQIETEECSFNYSLEHLPNDFKILTSHLTKIIVEKMSYDNFSNISTCEIHKLKVRLRQIIHETKKLLNYYLEYMEPYQTLEVNKIITILKDKLSFNLETYTDLICVSDKEKISKQSKDKSIQLKPKNPGGVILIEGKPGSGKTSILAGLISQCGLLSNEKKSVITQSCKKLQFAWIFDAVKSAYTKNSKDICLFDLLHDLIEYLIRNLGCKVLSQLKKALGIYEKAINEDFWRPVDIQSALLIWNTILRLISSIDVQITIFIDGIEQLKDGLEASTLNWIPLVLPSRFSLVITTLSGSKLSACGSSRNLVFYHYVSPIPLSYKQRVVENMLRRHGKSLDSLPFNNYTSEFCLKRDSDKPLYLKLAVNNLLTYATFDKIKEAINDLPPTLDLLILYSLKCIEKELPKEFCIVYFAFISNSKIGFTNEDMQMLMGIYFRVFISKSAKGLTTNDYSKLKIASKQSLCFPLYPLILIKNLSSLLLNEDPSGRITIKDDYFKSVINKYTMLIDQKVINYIISAYYENKLLISNDKIACRDLVYYKYSCKLFEECAEQLTNIKYLEQRFELGVAEELLNDYTGYEGINSSAYQEWCDVCSTDKFRNFKNFVTNNYHVLLKYPDLIWQQALNEPVGSHVHMGCRNLVTAPFIYKDSQPVICKVNKMIFNDADLESTCYPMHNNVSFATPCLELNIVAIGCQDGLIKLCKGNTFETYLNLRKHVSKINKMCFFESGTKLISVGEDIKAFIWNSVDGTLLKDLKGHHKPITDCIFSSQISVVGTTSLDSQFILWNSKDYQIEYTFKTKSPINCATIHPLNDLKAIVGCWNGNMIIYNLFEHQKVAVLHESVSVKSISFHPFYDLFVSSNIIGEIFIWNSRSGLKLNKILNEDTKFPSSVCYSSDGLYFTQFASNNSQYMGANIWSTAIGHNSDQNSLIDVSCIDSNKNYLVCGTKSGSIIVMSSNLSTIFQEEICELEITAISLQRSSLSLNSFDFAAVDYNRNFYIMTISRNEFEVKYKIDCMYSKPVNALFFYENYLISGCEDYSLGIFQVQEDGQWISLPPFRDIFLGSVSSIDVLENKILAGSYDKSIGLFNINDQILLNHEIQAHDDWVTAVCFASNKTFISGSNDCTIKIWKIEVSTNDDSAESLKSWDINENNFIFNVLHILKSHSGSITAISFYDDNLFASSSEDGTIKLWNMNGLIVDNLILEKDYSEILENKWAVKYIKFVDLTQKTLLAMDAKSGLHYLNLNSQCLLNKISCHSEPIISTFELENDLITISLDGSIRRWCVSEIFQKKYQHIKQHKITRSLYLESYPYFNDAIAAITDVGFLMMLVKDISEKRWKMISSFDLMPVYKNDAKIDFMSSPYIICNDLQKCNLKEIVIEFCHLSIYYNIYACGISKNGRATNKIESLLIDFYHETNQEIYFEFLQTESHKYAVRFPKKENLLELVSMENEESSKTVLARLPLNGYPCHGLIFVNSKNQHELFLSYIQGNVDIIEFLQIK